MEHVSIETATEKFRKFNMRIHFKIFNKMLAQYYISTSNELDFGSLLSIVKWIFRRFIFHSQPFNVWNLCMSFGSMV